MRSISTVLLLCALFACQSSRAQDAKGDSLRGVSLTAAQDTTRFRALQRLSGNWIHAHGQMDSALAAIGRAKAIYERIPQAQRPDVLRSRLKLYEYEGFALHSTSQNDKALPIFQEGARMAEANNLPVEVAGFYMYMSQVFGAMKDNASVRKYSQLALDILEPLGPSDDLALTRYTLAAYYMHIERWDSAEFVAKQVLAYYDSEGDPSRQIALENFLLQLYHRTRQLDSAEVHLRKAESIARAVDYPPAIGILHGQRSRIELYRGEFDAALASIDSSIAISTRLGMPFDKTEAYRIRSVALASLGRIDEAFNASDSAQASILEEMGIDEQREMAEARMAFEQEKEKALSAAELSRQRLQKWAAMAIGGLAVLLAFVWYRSFRAKSRAAEELRRKNEEIQRTQAQLVASEKQREAEQVRTRIARDIHDEIGATLTKIRLLSDVAATNTPEQLPDTQRALQRIGAHVRHVSGAMSDIVWAVDPARDTHQGMLDHVRELSRRLLGDNGITFDLDLSCTVGIAVMEPDLRRDLHLLINEAYNNILKYAKAKHVRTRLKLNSYLFELDIEDDGIGFDPSLVHGAGNGLRNMRERAARYEGKLRISSEPGKGTRITGEGRF